MALFCYGLVCYDPVKALPHVVIAIGSYGLGCYGPEWRKKILGVPQLRVGTDHRSLACCRDAQNPACMRACVHECMRDVQATVSIYFEERIPARTPACVCRRCQLGAPLRLDTSPGLAVLA